MSKTTMNDSAIFGLTFALLLSASSQAQLTLQAQTGSGGAQVNLGSSGQSLGPGMDVSGGFRIAETGGGLDEARVEFTVRPRVAGQPLVFRLEEAARESLGGLASYYEELAIVVRSPVTRTVTADVTVDLRARFTCNTPIGAMTLGGHVLTAPFAATLFTGQASQSWQVPLTVGPSGVRISTQGQGTFGGLSFCGLQHASAAWRVSIPDPDVCTFDAYDVPCGADLSGTDTDFSAPGQIVLTVRDPLPSTYGIVFVGSQRASWPTPWGCPLLVDFFGTIPIQIDSATAIGVMRFPARSFSGALQFQAGLADFANATVRFTNGLQITCP